MLRCPGTKECCSRSTDGFFADGFFADGFFADGFFADGFFADFEPVQIGLRAYALYQWRNHNKPMIECKYSGGGIN